MATIRLVPSTYYLSSSSYLSVSNINNAYANTDSDTYATVTNTRQRTSSYYVYLRGFNFDDVPENAIVSSFEVKFKARESGVSTSSSYRPYMCHNTSTITGTCSAVSTTATTQTFTGVGVTWETLKGYGSNFGIRFNCRRASSGTTSYMYLYGAEIEVTYTIPTPRTLSVSSSGDGTVTPSGTSTVYDGDEVEVVISPTNKSDTVTVTHNGTDVTSQLVAHGAGSTSTFTADDVTTHSIQSGSSYAEYAVGRSAENPYSSGNNMYASSGSTGYAAYSFDFSSIPSNAVIEDIEVRAYGHRESSTISSSYVSQCVLYNGSTAISEEVDFPYTSDSLITITPTDMPTRSELDSVTLRHYVGYYGGLVLGISFVVTYSTGTGLDHYTYTFTVSADANIVVTIGGASQPVLYIKQNGTWKTVSRVYKKVNGAWVEQDITTVFDTSAKYHHKEV